MEWVFRLASPLAFYSLCGFTILLVVLRKFWRCTSFYRYSLVTELRRAGFARLFSHKKVFFILRLLQLFVLAFVAGRPQFIDPQSNVQVEGINIVLALDISGSMENPDAGQNNESRIEVAKREAAHFIDKRNNDALGLVLFANDAVSRCPLTLDKKILHDVLQEVEIGSIDPSGTLLSRGLVVALNRLRKLKASSKSNVVILLTDGSPSENDIDPEIAIKAAQQLGVKVYTIGIGSEQDRTIMHPIYGVIIQPKINGELLGRIAGQTGGKFFMAHKPGDMRLIYEKIDELEKVEQELPLFSNAFDIFMPFILIVMLLLGIEILLSSIVWFGI